MKYYWQCSWDQGTGKDREICHAHSRTFQSALAAAKSGANHEHANFVSVYKKGKRNDTFFASAKAIIEDSKLGDNECITADGKVVKVNEHYYHLSILWSYAFPVVEIKKVGVLFKNLSISGKIKSFEFSDYRTLDPSTIKKCLFSSEKLARNAAAATIQETIMILLTQLGMLKNDKIVSLKPGKLSIKKG